MNLTDLKATYNILIAQEKKADASFKDSQYTDEQKESWFPKFNKITEELSRLMREYKEITGEEMDLDNVLNGFDM